MTIAAAQELSCFHCGDPCPEPDVDAAGRAFCCRGCRAVCEILSANGLDQYYALAERPGTSRAERPKGKYDYLDDPEIGRLLLDGDPRDRATTLHLPQIHCASCVWLLENLSRLDPGIHRAQVDFMRRELTLGFDAERTSLRRVVELLDSIGYAPEITLGGGRARRDEEGAALARKVAVAGFCFGNAMLFSLPEYLAAAEGLDAQWRRLFTYASVPLALPSLLYSGFDYLAAGWRVVGRRIVTIDVPIALGMIALCGRSLYEIATGTGSGYVDSLTGLVFFLLLGRVFQRRTFAALSFDRDYRAYFPLAATVVESGRERSMPVSALAPGARVLVRHGELVPTDGRLGSPAARIDYGYVTGEAEPVAVARGAEVRAGGRVIGVAAEVEVTREASRSQLMRLWDHVVFGRERGAGFEQLVNAFSKYFTAGVLAIAALAAAWWARTDAGAATHVFTSVLIIACPCALALATPFTMGAALGALARAGLFLRDAQVVERLAGIDAIVCDKTGTLTSTRHNEVAYVGAPLAARDRARLVALLRNSVHPLSRRVRETLGAGAGGAVTAYEETPGRGLRARVDGVEVVAGSRQWVGAAGEDGAAGTRVHVKIGGAYRGAFVLGSAYRRGVGDALAALGRRFPLFLLSGDNDRERPRLRPYFRDERMRFGQSPVDKLEFVDALQRRGAAALMLGDGLNDAGALRASAVGIAVSEDADAFSPACDGILEADRLARLPDLLRLARGARRIVVASVALSLAYNAVGVGFAVQGLLSPLVSAVLMPLSSISVMAFTTGATRLLARRLGVGA